MKRRNDIPKFIARIKVLHTQTRTHEKSTFTIRKGNGRTTRNGIERPMLLLISFFLFYRICVAVQRVLLLFVRAIHTYATRYSKIISFHFVVMKSMPSSSSSTSLFCVKKKLFRTDKLNCLKVFSSSWMHFEFH